jgi:Secretion system C-terminal sorting domain
MMMKKIILFIIIVGAFFENSFSQCSASFSFNTRTNDTTYFTSTSTANGTNLIYNWSFGDTLNTASSSSPNPYHYFTVKCTKYNVCLSIFNLADSCFNQYCDSIYVNSPSMVASFSVAQSDSNVILTNTSSGKYATSYWSFGDGTLAYTQNASHTYLPHYQHDTIKLTVKNIYNCSSSASKIVYVGCIDSFNINVINGAFIDSITLIPYSNQSIKTATWSIDGGSILNQVNSSPNGSNPVSTAVTAQSNYLACLQTTDANGCIANYCNWIDFASGISSVINVVDNIAVIPNPSDGKFVINFNLSDNQKLNFSVFDIDGRKLSEFSKDYSSKGKYAESIDLTKFSTGIYFLRIQNSQNESYFKKLVISKN